MAKGRAALGRKAKRERKRNSSTFDNFSSCASAAQQLAGMRQMSELQINEDERAR